MDSAGFALFDTAVGRCGVAWSRRGVCALQLPEGDDDATRARLQRRSPGGHEDEPPAEVQALIAGVQALLRGEPADFASAPLDFAGEPPFHRRVYEAARRIPPGVTVTYGALAEQVGEPGAARAVGQALGRNPIALVVPCHRVVAAGGKSGGFSAAGGAAAKLRLLAIEGAAAARQPGLFD